MAIRTLLGHWRILPKSHAKESIVVFGYNEMTQPLLEKFAQEQKATGRENRNSIFGFSREQEGILVTREEISMEQKARYSLAGIRIVQGNLLEGTNREQKKLLDQFNLSRTRKIFLFHEEVSRNYALYQLPSEIVSDQKDGEDLSFLLAGHQDAMNYLTSLHKKSCSSDQNHSRRISLDLIEPEKLRARAMLESFSPTTVVKKSQNLAVNLLLVGFTELSQKYLLESLSSCILSSDNPIRISFSLLIPDRSVNGSNHRSIPPFFCPHKRKDISSIRKRLMEPMKSRSSRIH